VVVVVPDAVIIVCRAGTTRNESDSVSMAASASPYGSTTAFDAPDAGLQRARDVP